MLNQAARIYTPKVYELFEEEYGKFLNCVIYKSGLNGTLQTYTVIGGYKDKKKECVVQYDSSTDHINCSCKSFEFIGIQCCHVLKVLDTINAKELPEKYYLKRWRMDPKDEIDITSHETSQVDVEASIANHYGSLMHIYNYIIFTASQSRRGYEYAKELEREFRCKVEIFLREENNEPALNNKILEPSQRGSSQKNVESVSKKVFGVKKKDVARESGRYKSILEKKKGKKKYDI
jgi:zinc finger SWIM domain-containing protein 3